jgi:hypothetical protein
MSLRIISVTIAMDSEVELLTPEDKALVKSRKQHILSSAEFLYRNSEQSVIASRITCHDGRVAVRTGLICNQKLTLERVLQVHEFGLVKFQKSHKNIFLV